MGNEHLADFYENPCGQCGSPAGVVCEHDEEAVRYDANKRRHPMAAAQGLTSCDFVGDAGCSEPTCTRCHGRVTPQPPPTPNEKPAVWDLVFADMRARDAFGEAKYKTRLQPHNGRDYLVDAYQEALDLVVYLRGLLFERDGR